MITPDAPARPANVVLRLYVAGSTRQSTRALINIKSLCETHLHDNYVLKVTDLYEQRDHSPDDSIMAAPALVRQFPLPECRIFGDLSETDRVLAALDLPRGVA